MWHASFKLGGWPGFFLWTCAFVWHFCPSHIMSEIALPKATTLVLKQVSASLWMNFTRRDSLCGNAMWHNSHNQTERSLPCSEVAPNFLPYWWIGTTTVSNEIKLDQEDVAGHCGTLTFFNPNSTVHTYTNVCNSMSQFIHIHIHVIHSHTLIRVIHFTDESCKPETRLRQALNPLIVCSGAHLPIRAAQMTIVISMWHCWQTFDKMALALL